MGIEKMNRRDVLKGIASTALVAGMESNGSAEEIPAFEQSVRHTFKELLGDKKFSERRLERNEDRTLCIWEILFTADDGRAEFAYYQSTVPDEPDKLYVTFLDDESGFPCGGEDVARHIDGAWVISLEYRNT